jgi:hypothetical protein
MMIKTSGYTGTDKTRRLDEINRVIYEVFPEPNRQLLQRYLPYYNLYVYILFLVKKICVVNIVMLVVS